ncbi:MAG: Holliday junction branch migration protein RuvA [Stagnimonas sp.]|nr:Holliday junction branch migration protein RuvA [Stagnimonas sp.]
MIGRLTGKLVQKTPPQLLVDVGGVGYELEAPMSTFYKLPAVGEALTLHTHLTVREDAHLLFAFASTQEKALFRELIKLSGVGPKLALAVLSGVSVEEFWTLVRLGDTLRLTKLPGIGKKTAERMVLELREKAGAAESTGLPGGPQASAPATPLAEARSALEALGYKPAEADKLLNAIKLEGMGTDQLIREALKRAVR